MELNFFVFIIYSVVLKYVISQCIVNNENIPEGCHTCIGTNFEQIFQIGVCKNANFIVSQCELGKRCVMATQCQATCEVVDERECTVSVCSGSTGKNVKISFNKSPCNCTNPTKKDGCLFCNGAWQHERTPLVMCKSGQLSSQSCPGDQWCLGLGECKAKCGKVVDGNQETSSESPVKASGNSVVLIFIIVGIAIAVIILTILGICWCYRRRISLVFFKTPNIETESLEIYLKKLATVTSSPNMCTLRLIPLDQLIMDKKKLGEGEFGTVYAGKFILVENSGKKFPVAIKVINKNTNLRNNIEQEMIKESGIMAQLDHEHLLKLVGICVANGIKIITPLRPLGSLHNFLQTKKQYLGPRELTLYCYQIASAMEHLAKHNIVHRDLATRNVLMKRYHHLEVADFGLSALLEGDIRSPQKLPFRWVPLECLNDLSAKMYCEASDVWSYGVTCWEILKFAEVPYRNLKFEPKTALYTLSKYLSNGNRLEKPSNCGLEFYQMLLLCWAHSPKSRPEFSMLKETLEKFKKNSYAYVNDHRQHPNQLEPTVDSDEAQATLINEMLGQDDYLYDDIDMQLHGDTTKNPNHNYYIDEKHSSFKKSTSASNICDNSGYLFSKGKIEKENLYNKPMKLYRSNSYIELVSYKNGN